MNCKNCGAMLNDGEKFCRNCGTPAGNDVGQNNMGYNNYPNYDQQGGNQGGNYGQPVAQNYANNMNYSQASGLSTGKIVGIVAGALLIFIVIVAVAAGVLVKTGKISIAGITDKKTETLEKKSEETSEKKSGDTVEDATTTGSSQVKFKVNHNDFIYEIPEDYLYEVDTNFISISDKEETWLCQIKATEGSFEQVKARKSSLKSAFASSLYTLSDPIDKTHSGKEIIVLEADTEGEKFAICLTGAGSNHFITFTMISETGEIDYTILDKIMPILTTATYSQPTTDSTLNIESNMGLSNEAIDKLAKDIKKK